VERHKVESCLKYNTFYQDTHQSPKSKPLVNISFRQSVWLRL
jgi:hypothetical protein